MDMTCINPPIFMQELYTWKSLTDIPNQLGFRFVGLTCDNLQPVCTVTRRKGIYSILGCPFTRLVAWRDFTEMDAEALRHTL